MSGKPIRKTQAISPFGPGAIVDFPGPVSMIHAGLDAYPFDPENYDHKAEFMIKDETRLSERLNVNYFVEPMEYRPRRRGIKQKNENLELPFLRFPLWHMCPRCGMLHKSEYHRRDAPKCKGPIGTGADKGKEHPERVCIQVRFVTVCESGHISDFPWCEWMADSVAEPFKPIRGQQWLRMNSSGSASAAGITVRAEGFRNGKIVQIHPQKTLGHILGGAAQVSGDGSGAQSPLGRMGIVCQGHNPVLGVGSTIRPSNGCGQQLYVLLKNASNLYFPSVVSSIFIPTIEDNSITPEILDITQNDSFCLSLFDQLRNNDNGLLTEKQSKRMLERHYKHLANETNIKDLVVATNKHLIHRFLELDPDSNAYLSQMRQVQTLTAGHYRKCCEALEWYINPHLFLEKIRQEPEREHIEFDSQFEREQFEEELYRLEEFKVFTKEVQAGRPKVDLDVYVKNINDYPDWLSTRISKISQLNKLRETRAFTGFSRINSHSLTPAEKLELFTTNREQEWLPAVIVRGEGIFFQFSEERLNQWYENNIEKLRDKETQFTEARARYLNVDVGSISRVSAKKILIHTFSHVLINELVFDCGYGSASLKERMYFSERTNPSMSAVLIYTAASDTEGSMGGLVRQGSADRLPALIESAITRASWCSSDPVCIESHGQGPAGLNHAACHSCALLPETSCELMNLFLDRTLLVGSLTDRRMGFFAELLPE